FTVLPEAVSSVDDALQAGVNKVVLTGSLAAGKAILQRLANTVTPATLELSGCDAAFVLAGANVQLAARAIAFGLTFNRSATCMAPRRLFVHDSLAGPLEDTLGELLRQASPVQIPGGLGTAGALLNESLKMGGRLIAGQLHADGSIQGPCVLADATADMAMMTADVMAPIAALLRFGTVDAAVRDANKCPYRLGASIFGPPAAARDLARRLPVGVITINDLIAPTAHPRVTLAARGASGFGATRGAEGLLEMTTPVTIIERRGRWLPHLVPPMPNDENVLQAMLTMRHGGRLGVRCQALLQFVKAVRNR
ncbi:MAG: aldehyde dehydrogenase family protein, partial [Phycisphaerales bacterium]|nr:aldehyde dehydrogenase family protein [Phycisphaerales bacterium]